MMRSFKRVLLSLMALLFLAFAFRGWIYQRLITYRVTGERPDLVVEDGRLAAYIEHSIHKERYGVEEIIVLSLHITSKVLDFKADAAPVVRLGQGADAGGYAAFQAAVCNYLLRRFGLDGEWRARVLGCEMEALGVDIHRYFKGPLFRGHDIVRVENLATGERYHTDPCFHDYLHIDYVRVEEAEGVGGTVG